MRLIWSKVVRDGFLFALLHFATGSLTNETCEEAPIKLPDGVKRHYRVGVLAIRGEERAFIEWNKTYNTYLTQVVGRKFDPPISFSMEALDFISLYTAVETQRIDFMYVNPSAFSCMESEYGASSLATQRAIRTVGADRFITTEFGGVIFTRSDRDDLQTLQDLKGRSFAAASISGLGSGQAQFYALQQRGLDYLNDPVQAIFTSNQGVVVQMVERGEVDFGFVRTDQIEGRVSRGLNQMETFKFIEADYVVSGTEPFPFPLTTVLYPEWNTGALPHVDYRIQQAVQHALTTITPDHEAAEAGGYFGWQPTVSYMVLRDMQVSLGAIQLDPADGKMKCVRQTTLYDSIICPTGYFKRSEEQVSAGCSNFNKTCPDGMQCICRPCKRGFEVDVFQERSGAADQEGCGKMTVCGSSQQRAPLRFTFIDRLNRPTTDVSYFIHIGPGIAGTAVWEGNHTFTASIAVETVGVHVIELFVGGTQISQSPLLMEIVPRDCRAEFGKNSLREPDGRGECVCETNTFEINSGCVEVWVIVLATTLPVLALVLCCACIYQIHNSKKNEAYWRVKFSDLEFADPPEVLGRGTFGLVLKGEYRGTTVAVKKVLPAKPKEDGKSTGQWKRPGGSTERPGTESMAGTSTSGNLSLALTTHTAPTGNNRANGPNARSDSQFSAADGYGLPEVAEEPEGTHDEVDDLAAGPAVSFSDATPLGRGISGEELELVHDADTLVAEANDPFAAWRNSTPSSMLWKSSPVNSMAGMASGNGSLSKAWRWCGGKDELHDDFLEEMATIARLRHPCITTVMGAVVERGREPLLIMELMEHGSLYDLLRNTTLEIDGEIILPIVRDIARGMNFLHQAKPPIIHGDIKSQNVLVDMRFRAKVSDFGLTQKKKVGLHGTPFFMAPELLQGEGNTPKADVYAFAILLCEVYSRKDPYDGEDPRDVLLAVKDATLDPPKRCHLPEACPETLKGMIRQCWDNDKDKRPSFQEIDADLRTLDATNVNPLGAMRSKQRSTSRLLYDVFPRHIADALAEGRKVEPESKEEVTIFFSDIVGFTNISATVPPEKVSHMLDRLYTTFDELSRRHVVFKVETIGDAYMAVTNLVEDQPDHAVRIARFALDAVQAARETAIDLDDMSKGYVNIRVGFHSGPVVANVVGTRNPRYCLFGDTVNTASRMESNSIKGRIHMSQSAARCVRQQDRSLIIASRGWINVKGKGDMKTYWLLGDNSEGRSRRVPLRPTSSSGAAGGDLQRLTSANSISRVLSSANSLWSSDGGRAPSDHSDGGSGVGLGAGLGSGWDNASFNRLPSLDVAAGAPGSSALHLSNEARLPDMTGVFETIGEDAVAENKAESAEASVNAKHLASDAARAEAALGHPERVA